MYQLSADDLGYMVVVHATSEEDGCEGTATARFGPISLDIETRKSVDSILASGSASFQVTNRDEASSEEQGAKSAEVTMQLAVAQSETTLSMQAAKSSAQNRLVTVPTTFGAIAVRLHPRESRRFKICFNTECTSAVMVQRNRVVGEKSFDLLAESREARDRISLAVRCFSAKNNAQTAETLKAIMKKEEKPEEIVVADITYREIYALQEMWESMGVG